MLRQSLPVLFLLVAVTVGSGNFNNGQPFNEPESSGQNRVAGKSEQDGTLGTAPILTTSGTNTTDVFAEDVSRERPPQSAEEYEPQRDRKEAEEEAEVEEYEGEDEYEDELKAVAESHEAMSKDDTRNVSSSSVVGGAVAVIAERTPGTKSFDSHEITVVNHSDEDVASNEAITDLDEYDEEVAELLKYKKERNNEEKTKTKRVPTVKKELSTQKEILIGSNETQVPKSLVPSEDTLNRLNEETEPVRRRNAEINGLTDTEKTLERPTEGEIPVDNRYSESENSEYPKKLDNLRSYLLAVYGTEEEQRQKLRELGVQEEDALAQNLLKLLAKIAENPSRWERVQKVLANVTNDLKHMIRCNLEPAKRGFEPPLTFPTTVRTPDTSRKSRKKLKKKKKKPRHHSSTTTMTPAPVTPSLLTTTGTTLETTPVQWRLVAERLFSPPWQQDLQEEDPEKTGKIRYSVASKPRTLPSIRDLIEQNKSKSNLKTFDNERNTLLGDGPRDVSGQSRLVRFGKVNTHQPSHPEGHREFSDVYERPAESDRLSDYDADETYHRLRYNQLAPGSREYLGRRHEDDDYQNDFTLPEGFSRSREYQPSDFSIGKSWPEISYKYGRPWKTEEHLLLPMSSNKWPWRQNDPKYWQRGKFLPERNYWSASGNEDEFESETEKAWQQRKNAWERERSWPQEKQIKMSPPWQQSIKLYDREQTGDWEKSKNRSELSKVATTQEAKEKVALPQITMKTWNSLTSDPATWPYKLPGAKPWPKDENGKSYNPNADLVKKLGLDKQNTGWVKDESKNAGRKSKVVKQNRLTGSNESAKAFSQDAVKYRATERNSFSNKPGDYKPRPGEAVDTPTWSMMLPDAKKDWQKSGDSVNVQSDDAAAWPRKYDSKNSWSSEGTLPKIQSVGAWVMAADQSTWKPYQIKPLETNGNSRRWSSNGEKWNKETTWDEKSNWMDIQEEQPWSGKPGKPDWFSKSKDDTWTKSSDSWKVKGDPSWLAKPNKSSTWSSRIVDNHSWAVKEDNPAFWSTKSNESWPSKAVTKFSREPWPGKIKNEEDSWNSKSPEAASWKNNENWSRKLGWTKGNDLWQQKMNDEWSYAKGGSTGTWPSKWKQFAYHRVTAIPISKPGTTADASPSKGKNAFVAVSAVSSPKYSGNDWRKNEEEPRNENTRTDEQERSSLQVGLERPIYAWKKDASKGNTTDQLENQLEALRQIDFWPEAEKVPPTTSESTSPVVTNTTVATATTVQRQSTGSEPKKNDGLLEAHRQTISMK